MSIKPIDLQTLLMNLNQLGKEQAAGREGTALQQSVQGAAQQRKEDEAAKGVRMPKTPEEGAGAVRDREGGKRQAPGEGGAREGEPGPDESEEATGEPEIVRDPSVGGNVDISG